MRKSSLVMGASVSVLLCVIAVAYASFPEYPDDGDGEEFDYESGDADVSWNEVTYWGNYPYDIDGEGDLTTGSGIGYYGTDVSWFTESGEVDGAVKAVIKFEADYDEQGDATGLDNAYIYLSFRVYEWTGSGWSLIGSQTKTEEDTVYNMAYTMQVNYNFDDSEYKYRLIQKVYFDEPEIGTTLETEVTDQRHSTSSPCLYVDE